MTSPAISAPHTPPNPRAREQEDLQPFMLCDLCVSLWGIVFFVKDHFSRGRGGVAAVTVAAPRIAHPQPPQWRMPPFPKSLDPFTRGRGHHPRVAVSPRSIQIRIFAAGESCRDGRCSTPFITGRWSAAYRSYYYTGRTRFCLRDRAAVRLNARHRCLNVPCRGRQAVAALQDYSAFVPPRGPRAQWRLVPEEIQSFATLRAQCARRPRGQVLAGSAWSLSKSRAGSLPGAGARKVAAPRGWTLRAKARFNRCAVLRLPAGGKGPQLSTAKPGTWKRCRDLKSRAGTACASQIAKSRATTMNPDARAACWLAYAAPAFPRTLLARLRRLLRAYDELAASRRHVHDLRPLAQFRRASSCGSVSRKCYDTSFYDLGAPGGENK